MKARQSIRYAIASIALLFACHTGAQAQNLIRNGGFEDVGIDAWVLKSESMRNGATARIDTKQPHSGSSTMLLEQTRPLTIPSGAEEAPNLVRFLAEKGAAGTAVAQQNVGGIEAGKAYNLKFWYRASGLVREQRDNPKQGYAAFHVHIDWLDGAGKPLSDKAATVWVMNEQIGSPDDWVPVVNALAHKALRRSYIAPEGAKSATLRFSLSTYQPEATPKVWIDDVVFEDEDRPEDSESAPVQQLPLANAGFEEADGTTLKGWKAVGSATSVSANDPVHSGKKSIAVSDAGQGTFSGWSTDLPVQKDSQYSVSGWIKSGAVMPYSSVTGACLCVQFLDKDGQVIGEPVLSEPAAANSDWKEYRTRFVTPPADATTIRVIAGLEFAKGTAWFDDLSVSVRRFTGETVARIQRPSPRPSEGVTFATNLLANGDVESGEGEKPKGWTYVGRSEKDWKPDELAAFYREGRPDFKIGRGKGTWSHDLTYAGSGALLNASIDPPLSKNMQWYGRNPVDGYWLSDPMRCEPGKAYLAGGWIKPGANIEEAWFGPLQIQFFDASGRQLTPPTLGVRPGIGTMAAGAWNYWATLPYVTPKDAASMRLRFGHELNAAAGGWGKTYADNLAVWELPAGVSAEKTQDHANRTTQFWAWFRAAHATTKPPYLPSPVDAREYPSCLGRIENSAPGNLFSDPSAKVTLNVALTSQIGEGRKVAVRLQPFDWLGNPGEPVEINDVELKGYGEATATVTLPPSQSYGAFYLEGRIHEGDATVGTFSGRYAVMPPLERPRTFENIWGVTTLVPFYGDGRATETEMGQMLKRAGFGLSWINLHWGDDFAKSLREVEWYRSFGIRPIIRINGFPITRPIDQQHFEEMGRKIATTFQGKVAAYGNWGVEQANHRTVQAPVFRPVIGGQMLTDEEYDLILAALHKGIRSVDKQTPVLIGNIATDQNADTVRRLYGKPGEGRFDGAILNAYSGIVKMAQTTLKEFDAHGDTQKTVWQEETADQRSAVAGPERRRGEAEGPRNMVRVWLTMKAVLGDRLKAMTLWGFTSGGEPTDIVMVTPNLQPRPHYVAHAVMSDALADATLDGNLSQGNLSIFRWKRTDGPLLTVWANSGERSITFEVPAGQLTVMDLMGNRTQRKANGGVVSLKVTPSPVYVFGGGDLAISTRLDAKLEQGSVTANAPQIRLKLANNTDAETTGTVRFAGPVHEGDAPKPFKLAPRQSAEMTVAVQGQLPSDHRTSFAAECTTSDGAVYFATAALNFATAVKTTTPPSLDGTWNGWSAAPAVEFGKLPSQVFKGYGADVQYEGVDDVSGAFRLLWDASCLYLGVEAMDDSFYTQPETGKLGFMGDSIEFACQPDNELSPHALYWEYELYLPAAKPPAAASRRVPAPADMITDWKMNVRPTGERGNAIYQVAIPWKDLGITAPTTGKTISFALVLNDADVGQRLFGGRCRVRWFEGLDLKKTPENFGDVTLVDQQR